MLTSIATVIHKKTGSSSRLHLRHLTRCRPAQYNARTSTISKVFLTPGERLVIPAYTTTKRHPSHIHVDPHIFCVGNARKKSMKPQHPNTLVGNPIYRQALIDKTDDCVMNSEPGALVRRSDPAWGHSVHTTTVTGGRRLFKR